LGADAVSITGADWVHALLGAIAGVAGTGIQEARGLTNGLLLDIEFGADEISTNLKALCLILNTPSSRGLAFIGSGD
jgi:hypothetical protein